MPFLNRGYDPFIQFDPSEDPGGPSAPTAAPVPPLGAPLNPPVNGNNQLTVPGGGGGGGGGGNGISDRPVFNFPGLPGFTPPQFNRPTVQDAFNEPGYQFRLQSGSDALQRSAAAKGLLRTGGTLKSIDEYGQNFASNE
jgi:hypothetical protein